MELLIALVLFIGMIAIWFVLPDSVPVAAHSETEAAGAATLQQLA